MGTLNMRGFTIIETMLFLAISGLLIIAMLSGVGASINIQRYRDAVETFKTSLQNQYDELSSVQNDRSNNWDCTIQGQTTEGGTEIRGQSDCVLLGRYVTVVDKAVTIYSVVGHPANTTSQTGNDIDKILANYTLNVSTVASDSNVLEWDTRIAYPVAGTGSHTPTTPRSIAVLFIRSPDSGQIYTFTSDVVPASPNPTSLASMLVSGLHIPGQKEQTICVDSNGLFVNADSSIFINSYATGPSSIETRSNGYVQSIGGDTQC